MLELRNADRQFRNLQEEVIHAYEEKLKRDREKRERSLKQLQQREKQIREIMQASQLDLERLDRLVQEDEASLLDFLRDVRPALVDHPSYGMEDAKKIALSSRLQSPNRKIASVYAATLIASSSANLEGNPGERSNPWVLPYNPGQVKIQGSETGNGWGCWAQPYVPTEDAAAVFWFPFVPDQTGWWYLNALVTSHGFYILRANDEWWNCKDSAAHVEAVVDVYQYYWNGQKRFPILDIDQGNINDSERIDEYGEYDYQVALGAGDLTWVMVMLSLHTFARGGGSYSEVNFSDGVANYIEPLIVVAEPPGV